MNGVNKRIHSKVAYFGLSHGWGERTERVVFQRRTLICGQGGKTVLSQKLNTTVSTRTSIPDYG